MNNIFNNYGLNSVSDKTTTQATLHSRFARVGEYPFSSSSLHFLTRIFNTRPDFLIPRLFWGEIKNSTKLNIIRNSDTSLAVLVQLKRGKNLYT